MCVALGLSEPSVGFAATSLARHETAGRGATRGGLSDADVVASGGEWPLRCLRVVLIKTEIDAFQAFTGCAPACLHNPAAAAAVWTGRRRLLRSLLPPRPPLPPYQPHRASCGPRLPQTERLPAYSDTADNRGGENETWRVVGFPPPPSPHPCPTYVNPAPPFTPTQATAFIRSGSGTNIWLH